MRFRKRMFATAVVLLGLLLDTSILPFTSVNPLYMPRFSLCSILTIALLMGATQGILYGAVGGIILDVTLMVPTGLTSALFIVGGMICGWFSHARRRRLISTVVGPFFSLFLYEFAYMVYFYFSAQTLELSQFLALLARVGIGIVLIQLLYLPYYKVLKPHRSRYAR